MTSPEAFQRQVSDAVPLVLRDADGILGKGVATHDVVPDDEAFLREISPDVERLPECRAALGHPRGGVSWHSEKTWPDYALDDTDNDDDRSTRHPY